MANDRPAIIVTGGAGLLGSPICQTLAENGYDVYGLDQIELPEPLQSHPDITGIECDVTDFDSIRQAMAQIKDRGVAKIASVVHLAAYYDFSGDDSELYDRVTVEGTDRLLNALQMFELEQFIFTSTMLVHAPCEVGEHIREDDQLLAKWPYPESKIRTERLITEGHLEVRSVFLRIAGVYDDWGRQPTLVQQIKRIYERDFQSRFYPGDTSAGQALVHLDDVVEAVHRTVSRRGGIEPQTPILIGEPDPPGYGELQDAIGEHLYGKEWTTIHVPKPLAKVGATVNEAISEEDTFIKPFMVEMADDHYALDVSRANQMLGWQPRHRLRETLQKILDRLKDTPQRWYRENGLEPPQGEA